MKKNFLDFLGLPPLEDQPEQVQSMERPLPPEIVQYLQAKKEQPSVLDKFSNEEYEKAKQDGEERNENLGWAQFAASVGSSLARRDPSDVNNTFDKIRANNLDQTVGEFNRKKTQAIQDIDIKNKIDNNDPNSAKSKMLQSQIAKLYPNTFSSEEIATFTLADQDNILKPLELKARLDARKEDQANQIANRQLQRDSLSSSRQEARYDKKEKEAKLSDKQIESFGDIDNAAGDLNNLLAVLGDKSNWTGPTDGRIPDMFIGDDQVAWRSAVGKYKDAYRKAITGAGAGPTEIAILEKRLPSETDTLANFKAKAQEALKELERRKSNLSSNLEKGGKNVEGFKQEPTQKTNKVKVSNGKETLEIDADDLLDAEADGYRKI